MKNKVLVISPHPDDEAIGCGGTIRKHVEEGDYVHVIFLTSGEKGGHGRGEEETMKLREQEALNAAKILETHQSDFWREPDGSFEASEKNIVRLQNKLNDFQPDIIYAPHYDEDHQDHKAAALIIKQAFDKTDEKFTLPTTWMYEVWTPLQKFDHIVDISNYVEIKRKAIQAHACQCEAIKFDEAILCLNRYRGEMHSWPGGDYAEAFKKMKL